MDNARVTQADTDVASLLDARLEELASIGELLTRHISRERMPGWLRARLVTARDAARTARAALACHLCRVHVACLEDDALGYVCAECAMTDGPDIEMDYDEAVGR